MLPKGLIFSTILVAPILKVFIFLTILVAQVKGIEESDVTPGFVLCCPANPIKTGKVFDAQVSSKMKGFAFY